MSDLTCDLKNDIAIVTIRRPPHNFFDADLITTLADTFESLDENDDCRVSVLCSEGKSFCAGGDFGVEGEKADVEMIRRLYANGARLFSRKKPMIAAIQGAAIGGGLGLALTADIRIIAQSGYFCANFTKLGIHPGFGSSFTLPRLIGPARAAHIFYTGRRIGAEQAVDWGLAEEIAPDGGHIESAMGIAQEIAAASPIATRDIHRSLTGDLTTAVQTAIDQELRIQTENFKTEDFKEGVRSYRTKRKPEFKGR